MECQHCFHVDDAYNDTGKGIKLLVTVLLNIGITVAEIIGGLYSGSLSLLSDALHNFSDGLALILSYVAIRWAGKESDTRCTFGYKRATILAAFINSSVLVAISLLLFKEAFSRLIAPQPVNGSVVIWVAILGLAANALGAQLLRGGASGDLNIRASYVHMLGDSMSSLGVVIAGIAIIAWRAYWVDPLLTIIIGLYMIKESFVIIIRAVNILMQGVPENIDLDRVVATMQEIDGVEGIHHVHVWCLDEHNISLEAHVRVKDTLVSETAQTMERIERLLQENHGINHVILQFEHCDCHGSCSWSSRSLSNTLRLDLQDRPGS